VLENNGNLTIKDGTLKNDAVNGDAVILNNGTMTLDGAKIEGAPIGTEGYPEYAVVTSGELTVESGTAITSDRGAIKMEDGADVTINGGSFKVTLPRGLTTHVIYAKSGTLTINDGTFEMDNGAEGDAGASVICPAGATINIYDGNFKYEGPAGQSGIFQNYYGYRAYVYGGTYNDNTVVNNVADGYIAVEADDTWTVKEDIIEAATKEEVAEAIEQGKKAVLQDDIDWSTKISKDAELDLNGNTFKATSTIELSDNADLTMSDGDYKVNGTYGHIDVRPNSAEGSVVVFDNVDFSYNKKNNTYGPSTNRLGSVVEVCPTVAGGHVSIVFKNCKFDNAMVLFEGMSGKTGTFDATFKGCTFNALTSSAPIYVQNYIEGTIEISGCTFNLEVTSSTASAVSVSYSSSTKVDVDFSNNKVNATLAKATGSSVTGVDVVKVNGEPKEINVISIGGTTSSSNFEGKVKVSPAK